jgi:hypothetical protein
VPSVLTMYVCFASQSSALHKSFHASLQEYRSILTGDTDDSHHQQQQPSFESEALRLKYLKYVLTEKLSEASRHDGVFPQGSEKYQLYEAISDSGHEKNMREALASLQEALFQTSVNEAVMRIARQAALSAKARIAEQAAQQQSHGRGSLLATTRNFLSRSSGEKDHASRTGSSGVLTPTSSSGQKGSRFPSSGQDSEPGGSSSGGEDTGSDISVGEASSYSEGDVGGGVGSGTGSGPPLSSSGSSARSGGLMKKFHERFSSLSTKHKPRTVSLRRMGQSSEDVCKMELNMESINGGFDEVKWRCAGFLYETDEVARVAPSQIKIYAYPSNQLLTGKTDRSALSKFFKPGTVWSIDIGVVASE